MTRGTRVLDAVAICIVALVARPVHAQYPGVSAPFWQRPWHAGVDVGASIPTGAFSQAFDPGWDVGGNLALPISPHGAVWLQGDVNYASQSMSSSLAQAYGAAGGRASISSGTVDMVLNRRSIVWGDFTPYVLFGGGVYWRYVELDNSGAVGYCDPFLGYCGVYGLTVPVRTRTEIAPGFDAGGGFRVRLPPLRFFVEARYNNLYTRHGNTSFVPIVIGSEW